MGDVIADGRADVVLATSGYFDPATDYKLSVFAQQPPKPSAFACTPDASQLADVGNCPLLGIPATHLDQYRCN